TMNIAEAEEKRAEVVVDFGRGGDRAAGVGRAGPLVDADDRSQAVDRIDIRPLELADELAGIRREALDILPLPLCKQCVECQTTLAGAAGAGDDDQLAARNVEGDVLEVMGPRATDLDAVRVQIGGFAIGTGAHAAHLCEAKTCYCS